MGRSQPYSILNLICGALILVVNLYWIVHNMRLYWNYSDASILYIFRQPDWVIFMHIAWGCVGLWLGVRVIKNKIGPLKGILFQLSIVMLWTLSELFYYDVMLFLNL